MSMLAAVADFQRTHPDVGVMVIAHSDSFIHAYLKRVAADCGVDVARVQFVSIGRAVDRIRGQRPAVFFDHAVWEHGTPGTADIFAQVRARAWIQPTGTSETKGET